jgi:outer membrane protein OmpU
MKHVLLTTTAIAALTSAVAAEVTVSGSARIGIIATEGAAAITGDTQYNIGAHDQGFVEAIDAAYLGYRVSSNTTSAGIAINLTLATDLKVDAAERLELTALRGRIAHAASNGETAAIRNSAIADLTSIDGIITRVDATTTTAVAKAKDTTNSKNRVRVSFALSGETDNGLSYGASIRADQVSSEGGAGSQYLSGSFGKISMGDLNGADEQVVGDLAGVGFAGTGSHNSFGYQSSSHNLAYSVSMNGVTFAMSTDLVRGADATLTGSNSAVGIGWSGDMGGTTLGLNVGQSKIGTKTEKSMSASVSVGGLTIKAQSHSNDNGPTVASVAASTGSWATGTAHTVSTAADTTPDTDTTGLSVSYSMGAMSVSAFTRTVDDNTAGTADEDYSGFGFSYNLGGATVSGGVADGNDISSTSLGINFSF